MPFVVLEPDDAQYSLSFPKWMSQEARNMINEAKDIYLLSEKPCLRYMGKKQLIDATATELPIPKNLPNGSWILRAE